MGGLEVVNRRTGEILDVRDADTVRLAEFCSDLDAIRGELADAEAAVKMELLRRMDADATWTLRLSEYNSGWVVSAPSPSAGTTEYPPDVLLTELRGLVDRGTVTEDAALGALDRRLVVEFAAPLDADLADLAFRAVEQLKVDLGGVEMRVAKAGGVEKPSKRGISALGKVPGTKAALDRASVSVAPARRVTVKREVNGDR